MKFYKHVYAIFGLGIVLAAVSVANSSSILKAVPTQNVVVMNTTANPVRTSPVGNTNVVGSVGITNNADTPVPVRDVDSAAHVPVTFSGGAFFNVNDVDKAGAILYTVPPGKRLVVESVFVTSFQIPTGQKLVMMGIGAISNNLHTIPFTYQGSDFDGYEIFNGTFSGTIRFPEGNQIRMLASRNATGGECGASLVVYGYLENM